MRRSAFRMMPLLTVALAAQALASGGGVSGKVSTEGESSRTIVYVEKVAKPAAPSAERPQMTQRNSQFAPDALVVVQGQTVDFPNEDKFFHNVFSLSASNPFDLGLYRGGLSKSVQMQEPGEVEVFCNIHPDMMAKILVLQNTFYVDVAKDGSYSISGLPDGKYTLVAWSASHQPEKKQIEVKSGAARADFELKPRRKAPHLNKNGEQYGRYK
jgi:plastocyanin